MSRRAVWVGGIAAGALALRAALIATRGDFLEFDESFYILIARSLREGRGLDLNGLPAVAFPPLPAFFLAFLDAVFGSMLAPSRAASAILGALLVVPVHRVGVRWFGRRAGLAAALLAAVCPTLMSFLPVMLPAPRRLDFGHESLYLVLVYAAIWALHGILRRPTLPRGIALGAVSGLAYLTRNEAILLGAAAVLVAGLAALARDPGTPGRRARGLGAAAAAAATLALAAAPFVVYLHGVTGRWTLSGKAGTAALIRPTVVAWVRDGDFYPYEKALYALAPSGDRMMSSYWGYAGHGSEGSLDLSVPAILDNLEVYATIALPTLLPWPTWPFILLGAWRLARGRAGPPRGSRALAHAASAILILPSAAVCLLLFVEPRHHLYLVPAALMVAAAGIQEAARWSRRRRAGAVLAAAALALLALSLHPLAILHRDDQIRPEATKVRRMGVILARELAPEETVASYHPALAYWAGRDWRVLPAASFSQIVAYAVRRGMTVLVLERGVFGPPPGEPPGPGAPFAVFRIEGVSAEEADRSLYAVEKLERNDLFLRYRIAGPSAGPAPAAALGACPPPRDGAILAAWNGEIAPGSRAAPSWREPFSPWRWSGSPPGTSRSPFSWGTVRTTPRRRSRSWWTGTSTSATSFAGGSSPTPGRSPSARAASGTRSTRS